MVSVDDKITPEDIKESPFLKNTPLGECSRVKIPEGYIEYLRIGNPNNPNEAHSQMTMYDKEGNIINWVSVKCANRENYSFSE